MAFLPGIGRFLQGGANPHAYAEPYLNQIPGFGQQAYQPFINQGQQAQGQLPNYGQMAQNPTDYYNQLASGYKPSQQYQNQFEQGSRALDANAAAGGYRGTQDDQRSRGELLNKLMGEDFQQFLGNILGIQGFGAQGVENQVNRGFGASSSLADYLGAANLNQASSAFGGKQSQTANKYGLINALIGAGGQAAGGYFGGKALAALA